jgi:hypothetical protein
MMTEELYNDYTKCLLYPTYAIEKYFRLHDSNGRDIPFKLNENQKRLVSYLSIYRFNIAKTSRSVGASSILAAWTAAKLAFSDIENPEFISYITHNLSSAQNFLSKVKFFLRAIPRWVWGEEYVNDPTKNIFKIDKSREFILPNRATLKIPIATPDGFRGHNPTHLIIDNAAYISNGLEMFSAMMTVMGSRRDSKVTIVSTPSSNDKFFKKVYEDSMSMKTQFSVIDMLWPYDSKFNEGLVWYKDGETFYEEDFSEKSISMMLYNEWKPSSPWYNNIASRYGQAPSYLHQEYNGLFL